MPRVASFPPSDTTLSRTLPFWIKKQSVRRLALREDRILPLKRQHVPTLPNGCKKGVGIEIEFFLRGRDLL